ncbi:hypothetical protein [Fuchsiella alkaliacetigena]|uniref:hypothetical protein n=1 Tax=Fuchsiella alkaliacetigena TaxID=957042 RepID=UPI00200A191E|nr:hypothetical protein [Fuchsiella alkaliacetigena]MCK8824194.1 hypothetical protein [Fuchsiella alkaliacetigena]
MLRKDFKSETEVLLELLKSVSSGEKALANILEAQVEKIEKVIADQNFTLEDIIKFQHSLGLMMKNSKQLQMLFQLKLDDILEFRDKLQSKPQQKGSLQLSQLAEEEKTSFYFLGGIDVVALSEGSDFKSGFIYGVKSKESCLELETLNHSLEVEYSTGLNIILIKGRAKLTKLLATGEVLNDRGNFEFELRNLGRDTWDKEGFRMKIVADNEERLTHNSDFVELSERLILK